MEGSLLLGYLQLDLYAQWENGRWYRPSWRGAKVLLGDTYVQDLHHHNTTYYIAKKL